MSPPAPHHRRVLVIDDNPAIHEDFQKILATPEGSTSLDALESVLFGAPQTRSGPYHFEVDTASQGEEGVKRVRDAQHEGRPYALAFVDIRMPPGIDGVETTARLWQEDPDLQVVLCSAYADYSWEEVAHRLGINQRLLILRKPFDNIEVRQMAHALAEKWELSRQSRRRMDDLAQAVAERTKELEATHERLRQEIEDRARLEARMAHVHRLESLGRLAAGMANEVSSPLGFVSSNLNHLRLALEKQVAGGQLEDPADLLEACRDALEGARAPQAHRPGREVLRPGGSAAGQPGETCARCWSSPSPGRSARWAHACGWCVTSRRLLPCRPTRRAWSRSSCTCSSMPPRRCRRLSPSPGYASPRASRTRTSSSRSRTTAAASSRSS